MEPINGVGSASGALSCPPEGGATLASLAAKICTGGDIASECMALMAEDNACQMQAGLQGIRVQQRAVRQVRQRRMELLKKQWAASRRSGFWAKLGKMFSCVFSVLAGALSFFVCPLFAAAGVGVAGAAVSGGCGIASGAHARKAGQAAADALQAEQYKQIAGEAREDLLQSLCNAAELEKRLAAKISALVESGDRSVVLK